jgi:hypothetical protein
MHVRIDGHKASIRAFDTVTPDDDWITRTSTVREIADGGTGNSNSKVSHWLS